MKGFLALLAVALLAIGTGSAGAAGARSGPRVSPTVYPAPIAPLHTGALSECPNPHGIVRFAPAAVKVAMTQTLDFGGESLQTQRLASDRSFWSMLPGPTSGTAPVGGGEPDATFAVPARGATGPGHLIIGHSCGARLVRETETVVVVPLQANGQPQTCLACRASFFYIDRDGHALLYYIY